MARSVQRLVHVWRVEAVQSSQGHGLFGEGHGERRQLSPFIVGAVGGANGPRGGNERIDRDASGRGMYKADVHSELD